MRSHKPIIKKTLFYSNQAGVSKSIRILRSSHIVFGLTVGSINIKGIHLIRKI